MLRPLSLFLFSLLAWLSAGARDVAHPPELAAWSSARSASEVHARVVDARTLLHTRVARPADHRAAPREGAHPFDLQAPVDLQTAPRSICRAAELRASTSSALALSFPYDATAPPARV